MFRKTMLMSVILLLTLLFSSTMFLVTPVSASTTRLHIEPQSIIDESLTPCNNITLTINVSDVTNLYAYELKIYFKSSVLTATKVVRPPGHFLEPSDPTGQFVAKWEIKNDFNATHGRIWLGLTLLAPETARSGSGTLAEVTFHVEGVGSTMLSFRDTKLSDDAATPIAHEAESGYFSNAPPPPPPTPAKIYVEPERIVDLELVPCENFTVNVDILDAEDLYAFQLKLSYDPAVLEALEIVEGTFLSSVGATSLLGTEIDNTEGFVWIAVTLLSPSAASGNGTLATITFHIIGTGATPLTVYETSLTDPEAQPLPHTTKHGFFANVLVAFECVVDFDPHTINLEVKGDWVTGYIELPEGYDVAGIEVSSILLNGTILVDPGAPTEIGDYDGDGVQDLMVKFNRTQVSQLAISQNITTGDVTLNVTGYLVDGTPFEGSRDVRVRMLGDINVDGFVDIYDVVLAAEAFGSYPSHPRWNSAADENEDGIVDLFDLVSILIVFGYEY